jgi:hypothetical protein
MAQDINFLPELTEDERRQRTYSRRVNFVAIFSLLVMGAVLLGLFGYWAFLAANAQRIQSQTKDAEQEIISQSRKEITRRALVNRLDKAKEFIDSVLPFSTAADKIIVFFTGSGASLTDSEFKENGDMTIGGEFADPSQFNRLVNRFTSTSETENFQEVTLVSMVKDTTSEEGGNYIFTLGVKYLKKGISGSTTSASTTNPSLEVSP